jgi:predicted nucleotidyltransferase
LKQISLEHLKEVLDVLEEVFAELNIDFYMIGAIAKEYWYTQGNKRMRQTKDVDFAVFVASHEEYEAVLNRLKDHHFVNTRENAFVMISPQGIQVDLLPFGAIAIDEGVELTGEGMTSIRVNGFNEVYQAGTAEVVVNTGHVFKAATLPAIVLLKFIAYDDRPEKRQKDARDIAGIVQHFFELQSDLIYENHHDLFAEGQPDRELEEIAAIAIGREMRRICMENPALKDRMEAILGTHIEKGQASAFIQQMVGETNRPVEIIIGWLQEVKSGLLGG